jgi:formate hydrogenlyase subunit 3/multisubunit Na+/H+ antiporter MnhD subunit
MTFGQAAGVGGAFFHLITHAAMKGLAFLSAGALLYVIHLANGNHEPLVLDDLNGASRRYPVVAFALSVAVLGLGGLPPLAGFMSKWQIFVAGVSTANPWMIAIVIFAAFNSLLSLGYYAPLVNRMYRNEMGPAVKLGKALSLWMVVPLVILALVVIIAGFWPPLLTWLSDLATASLQPILIVGGR